MADRSPTTGCRTPLVLGLTFEAPSGYIVETLFKGDRALDLMCDSDKGTRAVTIALNGSADELFRDEINLNRADH
ncbi:MAG TPA: hypothetical protein VKN18_25960 [Blastocatellia bacterium]|nr:hypothetical protein [Blastocatellia bacterium]